MIDTTSDNYLEYDYNEHFYYLTIAGVSEYTGYDYLQVVESNFDKKLKKMGRALHLKYTESAHNQIDNRYKHKDIVEWTVWKNQHGERQAIIQSLVNMVELDNDTEWFRDVYAGAEWPQFILQPIQDVGIYYRGEFIGAVPEDDYALRGDETSGY